MDFKQLEAYIAVVDRNSFSEAAKYLFLTQPTISGYVRALEEELSTTLIQRTTKTFHITKEGLRFYDYAVNLIKLKNKAMEEFLNSSNNIVRLGASTIPSAYILPSIIAEYKQNNPKTVFNVAGGDSGSIVNRLLDNSIDIGIVGAAGTETQIDFTPFVKDRIVICAPANDYYKRLKHEKISLKSLLLEPIILREQSSGTRKEASLVLERYGYSEADLNVVAYINDLESIKRCITGGMGISIVSALSVQDVMAEGKVITFEPEEFSGGRYFYIATRKDKPLSETEEAFVQYLYKVKNQWNAEKVRNNVNGDV